MGRVLAALGALLGAALLATGPGASAGAVLVAVVATAAVGFAVRRRSLVPSGAWVHGLGRPLEAAVGAPRRPLPPLATSLRVRR